LAKHLAERFTIGTGMCSVGVVLCSASLGLWPAWPSADYTLGRNSGKTFAAIVLP